jgi:hypothetical protein
VIDRESEKTVSERGGYVLVLVNMEVLDKVPDRSNRSLSKASDCGNGFEREMATVLPIIAERDITVAVTDIRPVPVISVVRENRIESV